MIRLEHGGPAGTRPDPNVWRAQVGPVPNELQQYTAAGNAWVDGDGHLVLEARRGLDGVYTSARLDTKGRLRIEPGTRVEVEALLPHAPGCFPALWFVGSNQATVGYVQAGELDMVEVAGGWRPGTALLNAHAGYYDARLAQLADAKGSTLEQAKARQEHYQTGWQPSTWHDLDLDEWHTYAVDFDGNGVRWWIDNQVVLTRTKAQFDVAGVQWPFNKPMDLIVNLAVGSAGGQPVPADDGSWSATMQVGTIRIGRFAEFTV